MALSDRGISALKPKEKDSFVADGRGLYLRVHTSGTKTFMYRSRAGGSARWITLGQYPELTLAEARNQAQAMTGKALPGKLTVQEAYDKWIAKIRKKFKRPEQVEDRMKLHFLPRFGSRQCAQVTQNEIAKALSAVAATSPTAANRVLANVKQLFDYCESMGDIANSPADKIKPKAIGGSEESSDRWLDNDELVEFMGVLRSNWSASRQQLTSFEPRTRLALALLLLTGQRSVEVRNLTRAQVKGSVWTIPKSLTKTATPMKVYLAPVARRLVALAFKEFGTVPFVQKTGKHAGEVMERQTLSRATAAPSKGHVGMQFAEPFTPHDLRRTMRTHMAEIKVEVHIGEKCLNHKLTGVLGIYDRSEMADDKKAAWRLWERHLLRIAREAKKKPPALLTEG